MFWEKNASLPNRVKKHSDPKEEMEEREEIAQNTAVVYKRILPPLLKRLSKIEDFRQPQKVKHKIDVLMAYGILFFVFQMASRREGNREMSQAIFLANLQAIFPELETMPHGDTLSRLLKGIQVEEIEDCMIHLLKDLIRRKKFKNFIRNKQYLIAIDGTQKFSRDYCWDKEKCMKRNVGKGEEKSKEYYVYVLEATLVFSNGMVLPVLSEFVENSTIENASKQDCELKAFYRLAKKLKTYFPKTRLSILVDGLYACGPVVQVCQDSNWDFMITFKNGSMKEVYQEAQSLAELDEDNRQYIQWGERFQEYQWANDIEFYYKKGNRERKLVLHVVFCKETWMEKNKDTGDMEEKETTYAWLSKERLTIDNVFERCTHMGRYRWKIENNILKEKHQGYNYEHCFSYNWNAMKGYHYLMKIGHLINVLVLHTESLIKFVKEKGIRGFLRNQRLVFSGALLNKEKIQEAIHSTKQWRLAS